MNLGIATSAEVDKIWPLIGQEMQRGCDKTGGEISSGDMWQMCRSGNAFLIMGYEPDEIVVASVWRFETWPSGVVFKCVGVCGKPMKRWVRELYDFAFSQAKIGGTERLVAGGRMGWSRVLSRYLKRPVRNLWQTFEVRDAGR
jgi:hypothetical protein